MGSILQINSENQIVVMWVPLQILQSVSRLRIEFLKKDYSETINNLPGIFYLYDESGKF
jgi:hypothetical protein